MKPKELKRINVYGRIYEQMSDNTGRWNTYGYGIIGGEYALCLNYISQLELKLENMKNEKKSRRNNQIN